MARLDDYSILQPRYLVKADWEGHMTQPVFKTSVSHDFACTSSHAMSHATKEHLACRDLRET
jgi:hypothetical protein